MVTPEGGGDSDDGAIRTGFDLARYLDVSISAPKSIKSGELFDVNVGISLPAEYTEHARSLLALADYHREKFFSYVDVGLKNRVNGQMVKEHRELLLFYKHPEIFLQDKLFIFSKRDWRTVFPGKYLIIARVRRKDRYNDFDYSEEDLKNPQKKLLETGIVASPLEVFAEILKTPIPQTPTPISLSQSSGIKIQRTPDGNYRI